MSSGAEVLVQRVLKQGWAKLNRPGRIIGLIHQRDVTAESRMSSSASGRNSGRPLQYVQIEVPTNDGCHGQHPFCVRPEPHYPATDDFTDALGECHLVEGATRNPAAGNILVDGTDVAEMAEDLSHEEGVPVGLPVDRFGKIDANCVQWMTGDIFHQRLYP